MASCRTFLVQAENKPNHWGVLEWWREEEGEGDLMITKEVKRSASGACRYDGYNDG
jgi:hypothetical protein